MISRSSRIYDREFKRGAYVDLGVTEVWLVDIAAKSVEVWRKGETEVVRSVLRWGVPEIDRIVKIDGFGVCGGYVGRTFCVCDLETS